MIEVFARRANSKAAAALVASLRAAGKPARENNPRYFDPKQIDPAATLVYHDGTDPLVPWAYGQREVRCELLPGIEAEARHSPSPSDNYRLEKAGQWFKLIGPNGQQVGKAKRTEAEAWDQLKDVE